MGTSTAIADRVTGPGAPAGARPLCVLVCALGGEGGGVLARWLIDVARGAGHAAQSTSIPGVAQRTGATTYYLEFAPQPSRAGEPAPLLSLTPVPGALDLLVSSELLETVRQVGNGFAEPQRTLVLSSVHRSLTTQEKIVRADGRLPAETLLAIARAHSRELLSFDMAEEALASGAVISAVLLGAIAASGALPFERARYEAAIREGGKGADASLRGFTRAFERVSRLRQGTIAPAPVRTTAPAAAACASTRQLAPAVRGIAELGCARVREYLDQAYVDLYLQRVRRLQALEQEIDPLAVHGWELTRTVARLLALWMAFDDLARVAQLKSRRSRWERVRREVGAADGAQMRVFDYFKPGVPEFAALLPAALAGRLQRWERRRQAAGREPWGWPLALRTHSVRGLLVLRLLAALRHVRRAGSRYAREQASIEGWLQGVERAARTGWGAGHEVALCAGLVKGYGATNERGRDALQHVLDHLVTPAQLACADAAAAVRAAREAAQTDDSAFERALVQHGAPPPARREQPIRFVRR